MSTTTSNLGLFKYDTSTDGNVAFSIDQALNNNWDIIDTNWNQGSNRNIGEIIASTIPLIDAGLHLLDGSLIQSGGIYDDFVDYISGLVADYPDLFCTEAQWQQSVTNRGVCGKFVYDSVNNTVRLPKWGNNSYIGTNTLPIKGTGMTLGMTNNVEYFGIGKYGNDFYGSTTFYGLDASRGSSSNNIANCSMGVTTDSTKSGIVTDLSNDTQYYYIVIATTTKTDIQVDIDEIVTDLNGKADTDLGNLTSTGKTKLVTIAHELDWNNAITVSTTPSSSTQTYTPTVNGILFITSYMESGSGYKLSSVYIVKSELASTYHIYGNTVTATGSGSSTVATVSINWYCEANEEVTYYMYYYGTATYKECQATFVPFKES